MSILDQFNVPTINLDFKLMTQNRNILSSLRAIVAETGATVDFAALRASIKQTENRFGEIAQADTNVPALSFSNGVPNGFLSEEAATNLLGVTETPATQTVTVGAGQHTLSFYGTGEVVLSGVGTGTLTGTGEANDRVTLTFTATAGSLTLTVTGAPKKWQLETGAQATSYFPNAGAVGTTATRAKDNVTISDVAIALSSTSGSIQTTSNFPADYPLIVNGLQATVTGIKTVRFEYTTSEIKLFVDNVLADSATGTYDWSGLDKIDIGHYNGADQPNFELRDLIVRKA